MASNTCRILTVGFAALSVVVNAGKIDERKYRPEDIIERDVAIIGGGATGTYAAVRLREDLNQSVIVVEKKDRLGGHVNTYIDPATKTPVDYGVQVYDSLPAALAFFQRLNISMVPEPTAPFASTYVDLTSGMIIPGNPPDYTLALLTYAQLMQQYSYLSFGYGQIPDPVPLELLEPFGQFIQTYNLGPLVPIIWTFAFGVGNLTAATTLDVLQLFGPVQMQSLLSNGFLVPASGDNSVLYQEAAKLLGSDVLYKSVVTESYRVNGPQLLVVETPDGCKLIKANKLLITIPTTLSNMKPFDLDDEEEAVFKQWLTHNNYIAVVSNTGLPDGVEIINVDVTTHYGLPTLPFVWRYEYSGDSGHFIATVLGDDDLTETDAKNLILDGLTNIDQANPINVTRSPRFDAFTSHVPLQLHVEPEEVGDGFYKKLYALQGRRNTYYTGAGWAADYSSVLWQFTETILPALLA